MQRPIRDTLIAFLGGGVIGVGLYWVSGQLSLALVTGMCWAFGLKLTLYIGHLYPAYATGDTWADKRWTGLSAGLITLAALIGVSPMLPISNNLQLGLGLLIIGTGLVAYTAGTIAVLERVEGNSNATSSNLSTSSSMGND